MDSDLSAAYSLRHVGHYGPYGNQVFADTTPGPFDLSAGPRYTTQHVAAVGRRVSTLCKGEDGLRQQLALYQTYYNFCLPHASLRQPLPQPEPTNGSGSAKQWRPCTP